MRHDLNRSGPARQRGITFLGLVILVAFVGLFVYAGIRLSPAYLEYMAVARALDSLKTELSGGVNQDAIRRSIQRRFEVDDVSSISPRDVEIGRDRDVFTVRAAYGVQARFIANVDFLVSFDKTVEVPVN